MLHWYDRMFHLLRYRIVSFMDHNQINLANRNSPSFPQNAARFVSLSHDLFIFVALTFPVPIQFHFKFLGPFRHSRRPPTWKPENMYYFPIRTVASAAPTSSVSLIASLTHYLLTNALVCHQAALARCAAECVPKKPNADGVMFMTGTVYLFYCLISCAGESLRARERRTN